MNKALLIRVSFVIIFFAFSFYFYIDKQNRVTELKIEIPKRFAELTHLKEEVKELQYSLEQFQSPSRLMEFASLKEFSHLKYPFLKDILNVEEGLALNENIPIRSLQVPSLPIAVTTK